MLRAYLVSRRISQWTSWLFSEASIGDFSRNLLYHLTIQIHSLISLHNSRCFIELEWILSMSLFFFFFYSLSLIFSVYFDDSATLLSYVIATRMIARHEMDIFSKGVAPKDYSSRILILASRYSSRFRSYDRVASRITLIYDGTWRWYLPQSANVILYSSFI